MECYELVLKMLSPGGYIIADYTLWDGHVMEEPHHTDMQTIGIKKFNDLVAQDDRVEKVILPLRDGLTIIRKKKSNRYGNNQTEQSLSFDSERIERNFSSSNKINERRFSIRKHRSYQSRYEYCSCIS